MPLDIRIEGVRRLEEAGVSLSRARRVFKGLLVKSSKKFAVDAVSNVKQDYLSGGSNKLKVRTGRLRSSIVGRVLDQGEGVTVRFGTDVPYAAAHEFGTGPYTIVPRRKKFLSFVLGDRRIFTKSVNHPGVKERPFLRPGIKDEIPSYMRNIEDMLENAVRTGIGG